MTQTRADRSADLTSGPMLQKIILFSIPLAASSILQLLFNAADVVVVGLGPESFASLPPDMIQKYTEQFKRPELFASINGQIVSVPVEPENPLRTAEMTLEDDYGMIDGIINNGRRGEELEKAQTEARRTTPEKKPSIRERLEDAKRECAERKSPDKPAPQKKPPELGDL